MLFSDFIKKWTGQKCDFDGAFGSQCFDLYRYYCQEVLNVPQSPATGDKGALTIWDNYLKDYFDRIENTKENVPQNGDIVLWGTKIGKFGHVAIFIDGDVNKFNSFDCNFPTGTLPHTQSHTYNGVLGWLRLKVNVVKPDWVRAYLLERNIDISNEGDARARLAEVFTNATKFDEADQARIKAQEKLAEADGEIASLTTENAHLKGDLQKCGNENIDLKKAVADRDTTIYRLQQLVPTVPDPTAPEPKENWLIKLLKLFSKGV